MWIIYLGMLFPLLHRPALSHFNFTTSLNSWNPLENPPHNAQTRPKYFTVQKWNTNNHPPKSLEVALDNLSPSSGDDHIKDLANRVRGIQKANEQAKGNSLKAGELEEKALEREVRNADEREGVVEAPEEIEIERLS